MCGEWENGLLWPFLAQNAAQMCKTSNFEQKWRQSVTSGFYFGFYRKFLFWSIGVMSNYKKWGFESKLQRNAIMFQSLVFIIFTCTWWYIYNTLFNPFGEWKKNKNVTMWRWWEKITMHRRRNKITLIFIKLHFWKVSWVLSIYFHAFISLKNKEHRAFAMKSCGERSISSLKLIHHMFMGLYKVGVFEHYII